MIKKALLLVLILIFPFPGGEILPVGAAVEASIREKPSLVNDMGNRIKEGLDYLQEEFADIIKGIKGLSTDLQQLPESAELERLKKELDRLAEEMKKAGKTAKEKFKNEYLPRLREELNKLKEKLYRLGREEEVEPLEIKLEDLRQI